MSNINYGNPTSDLPVQVEHAKVRSRFTLLGNPRTRLFDGYSEWLLLFYPLIYLPIAIADIHTRFVTLPYVNFSILNFLMGFIFMDILHVGLTYSMLLGLPEFKEWSRVRGGGSSSRFHLKIFGLFAFLAVLFALSGAKEIVEAPGWRFYLSHVITPLMIVIPHFHTMWQSRGISFAYGRKSKMIQDFSSLEEERSKLCERIERIAFKVMYVSWVGIFISRAGLPMQTDATFEPLQSHYWLQVATTSVCALSVVTIWISAALNPVTRSTGKLLYLLRLVFWPMSFYSYAAIFAVATAHGVEYLLVYLRMKRASSADSTQKFKVGVQGTLFCAVLFAIWLPSYFTKEPLFLAAIGFAVAFVHYYLDRTIFQMRDPLNRNTAGKLLLENSYLTH